MEYKTITCKVCGEEFRPHKDQRYTVVRSPGLGVFMATPPLCDAMDCPHCGCQIILGNRMDVPIGDDEGLEEDPDD